MDNHEELNKTQSNMENFEMDSPNSRKRYSIHSQTKDQQSPPTKVTEKNGWLEIRLGKLTESKNSFVTVHRQRLRIVWNVVLNGIFLAFFFASLYYYIAVEGSPPLQYCTGFGSLLFLYGIIYIFIIYFNIIKRMFVRLDNTKGWTTFCVQFGKILNHITARIIIAGVILTCLVLFLYYDTRGSEHRLMSLVGVVTLLSLGFIFSAHRTRVNWRTVLSAMALQISFAFITIRWSTGREILQCFSDKVSTFLSYGVEGSAFVFGDLLVKEQGVFAFASLPIIFFFSTIVELLFYYGALQWFCLKLGGQLQSICRTTICESIIAVGNTFLGNTESILLIKPYIVLLTESEVHTIMSSGFATVSGTILAAYISFGADPSYLIIASVLSAPAALCFSKLSFPEVNESKTKRENIKPIESEDQSAISAMTRGATNGIPLILNVIANLAAFVSLVAFTNGVLAYCGSLFGNPELSLEWLFGKIFIPVSFIMGVPWDDCELVGSLIGIKTVINEFVAYQKLGEYKDQGLLSPRAEAIATFALCGFTNPASGGIMIGALSAIAPTQRETMAKVVVRAFFSGCAICFINASLAGLLMPEDFVSSSVVNTTLST